MFYKRFRLSWNDLLTSETDTRCPRPQHHPTRVPPQVAWRQPWRRLTSPGCIGPGRYKLWLWCSSECRDVEGRGSTSPLENSKVTGLFLPEQQGHWTIPSFFSFFFLTRSLDYSFLNNKVIGFFFPEQQDHWTIPSKTRSLDSSFLNKVIGLYLPGQQDHWTISSLRTRSLDNYFLNNAVTGLDYYSRITGSLDSSFLNNALDYSFLNNKVTGLFLPRQQGHSQDISFLNKAIAIFLPPQQTHWTLPY